jgi:chemotaxis protein CheD
MAHIVLPDSAGRDSAPGKFADTALPEMLAMLRAQGAPLAGLVAKLAGGANMFNGAGPLQIGDENVRAVTAALAKAGICPAAQDVGGNRGRRIEFDCANGAMIVQCAGLPPRVL